MLIKTRVFYFSVCSNKATTWTPVESGFISRLLQRHFCETSKPEPYLASHTRGADKSLARSGRKQPAPVKIVVGGGIDWFG